ncbi:magnesium transporter [Candidatus Woesearchaeota archaeon]|nr:magnesium transporter [Candidatus Woesearchaeota archaeon]
MAYFSELKNAKVYDASGKEMGVLVDLVFVDGTSYGEITHLVFRDLDNYKKKVTWAYVKELKGDEQSTVLKNNNSIQIHLNVRSREMVHFFIGERDMLVGDMLDKQVIDVNGVKVVRVNDVVLRKIDNKLYVAGVCVGSKSFLRRIGAGPLSSRFPSFFKEQVIPWKSVERLKSDVHDLRIKVQKTKVNELHPEDIADILEDLPQRERVMIFNTLDKKKAAQTLIAAESDVHDSLIKNWKMERIKELMENIPEDQAADILSMMSETKAQEVLSTLRKERSHKIKKILNYSPESAGAVMHTQFTAVPLHFTAREIINHLRKLAAEHQTAPSEHLFKVYVVDSFKDNHLVGVLSVKNLLIAPPRAKVDSFMKKEVIYVTLETSKDDIAKVMARYDLFVLPVVDKDKVLKGIVAADDVLHELMPSKWRQERLIPKRLRKDKVMSLLQ